jgi:PAS domain S-box-containing protein
MIAPDGTVLDVNEATVQATGIPREELIGSDFAQYWTDPELARNGVQWAFEHGSLTDGRLTARHRDGTLTDYLCNATVYRDINGQVLGVLTSARDVTRQMQVQRETAEQQASELERLEELERFKELTLGRELKMIELKKEIEYLRQFGPDGAEEPDDLTSDDLSPEHLSSEHLSSEHLSSEHLSSEHLSSDDPSSDGRRSDDLS